MATIPQTQSFKIFGAGASIGATSITLQTFKNLDGTNLTMAHFGGLKGFLTIEPSLGTQEEQVSFASITNNTNGTVTLGTIKNVLDYTPFTETAGLAKTHGGNVEVIVSNTSGFYNSIISGATASQIINVPAGNIAATDVQGALNELDLETVHKAGAEAITGVKTFDSSTGRPKLNTDVDSASSTDLVTVGQLSRTASSGASNASTTVKGIVQEATQSEVNAGTDTGSTGARLFVTPSKVSQPAGIILPYGGRAIPSTWLLCDGIAVSRTTYANLFAALCPQGTFSVTIASPAVFTKTTHLLVAGDIIHFTTTGSLPTGLLVNVEYYVISSGLTVNTFQVSTTRSGSAVNTVGSQSGVHTFFCTNDGKGDGSTTFNLPNMKGKTIFGYDSTDSNFDVLNTPNIYVGEKNHTLTAAESAVLTYGTNLVTSGSGTNYMPTANAQNAGQTNNGLPIYTNAGGGSHNNMPPYSVRNWIIKV